MSKTSKTFALFFALIFVMPCLSILMAEPATAQTISKPSPPEFTLKYVDNSYDVPPTATSTIDPYTGKTVTTTTPGYHVEDKAIEITVTNQLFMPYSDAEGHLIDLSFNVRFKGHFGGEADWVEPFFKPIRNGIYGFTSQHPQSKGWYTVISVPSDFREGDVVDFQVQTLAGYYTPWEPLPMPMGTSQFTGKSSDWSNTKTITLTSGASTTATSEPTMPTYAGNSTLTATLTAPETNDDSITLSLSTFIAIIVVSVLIAMVLPVLLLRRHRKTTNLKQ